MIGTTLGKVKIESVIGSGAMGVVYKGQHQTLGVPVAFKIIKPEYAENHELVQRFLQEAQLAARLRHPNVVRVYDVGEEGGINYIVMEFIEGQTLDDFYRQGGLTDMRTFFTVFHALASAIAEANAAGIVHRDIKPKNVIIGPDLKPVLTDFGIAAALTSDARLTTPGILLGTPAYMSPEGCRGDRELSAGSDVYSMGMMMYEVLSGGVPYYTDNVLELIARRIAEPTPQLPIAAAEVAGPLAAVVMTAVAHDPAARYADGQQLADALSVAYYQLYPNPNTSQDQLPVLQTRTPRPLELPTDETTAITTDGDLRYTDLHAIIAAAEQADTGYGMVALHYSQHTDLLLFEDRLLSAAIRWEDETFREINLDDINQRLAAEDYQGFVDSYAVSRRYLNALKAAALYPALIGGLRVAFFDFSALLSHLATEQASGVMRLQLGGRLGLVVFREGQLARLFCSTWLAGGTQTQTGGAQPQNAVASMTQLGSLLAYKPDTRVDFVSLEQSALQTGEFSQPEPALDPLEATQMVSFVTDVLAGSGTALAKAFGLGAESILDKYHDHAAESHPALLDGLELNDTQAVDSAQLLARIDQLPMTGRRTAVTSALVDLLVQRHQAVEAALGNTRKAKKAWKPAKDAWKRHKVQLREFGLAEPFTSVFGQ